MSPVGVVPPQTMAEVSFGQLADYSGGAQLPEGDYCLYFDVRVHQATDKLSGAARGQANLGVMIQAWDLHDPVAEPKEKFVSMGSKAKLTFQPNASGKGLALVPGGPAGSLNNKTNWFYLLESLYQCGMPEGVFSNDLTTIDGIHVHLSNIPEPEERKSYRKGAKTAVVDPDEKADDEPKGSGLMPVITEIYETGRPWEGTGGVPTAPLAIAPTAQATPVHAAPPPALAQPGPRPVAARPAPVAAAPVTRAPAAPPRAPARPAPVAVVQAPAEQNGDLQDVALTAIGNVLVQDKYKGGAPKLTLRTEVFKLAKTAAGEAAAQSVLSQFFSTDAKLAELLNTVGYGINGSMIVPLS
jgi:hypothetical protein